MVAWLLICVPLHYTWKLFGARSKWPSRFLGGIATIAGVKVQVLGQRARGGVFLLPNHVSWIDVPALAGVTGTAFVAHSGLAGVPLLRWLCEMNDTVFVARHDRGSVHEQVEQVRAAIRDNGALAIFPEGTTSDGTGLLPFKSSLLSALDPPPEGIPIQPVLLDYGPNTSAIAWVGNEPGVANFRRILGRSEPIGLTIHFLPPLTGPALGNRKTMAGAAREAILTALRR